ncbi:MAG: CoA transferase subunit A [Chloroflexota bacterium]|nr:CoA transferase subunit A [Chloroflexota bacterium]
MDNHKQQATGIARSAQGRGDSGPEARDPRLGTPKVKTLAEAAALVKDGDHLALSGFAIARNAAAFSHELIRQGRRNLSISQAIVGLDSDILVGAGCVSHLTYGGGSLDRFGPAQNISRAYEEKRIVAESYSSLAVCFRYLAGALGIPYMPITSLLGSEILERLKEVAPDNVREADCPFTNERLLLLRALQPDFAVVQAQYADEEGNARVLGPLWDTKEAARAAREVIVITEELVRTEFIRQQPELTLVPGLKVSAVVPLSYGAHPTSLFRCYDYDSEHLRRYAASSRDTSAFADYLAEFVLGPKDHNDYLERAGGVAKLASLKVDVVHGY